MIKRRSAKERGRYSKSKGKAFEDRIAEKMTSLTDKKWLRVPASGGWKKMEGISGDLFLASNPSCTPYHVECKSGKGWSFRDLLKGKGMLCDWISQAVEDNKYGRPILLFTSMGGTLFIGMNEPLFEDKVWNCLCWQGWYFGALSNYMEQVGFIGG